MSKKVEDFYPGLRDGWNFAGNVSVGGTLAATGATTLGALTVSSFINTGTAVGSKANVVNATATLAPTVAQSGTIFTLDAAAGFTTTLPAPIVGVRYVFIVKTTVTSNSYKIITDAGTTLLAGSILGSKDNTANKSWVGDGATHLAVTQAAASTNATGGIVGSWLEFICATTTLWQVNGLIIAGGTPTTPFATS